MKWFGVKLVYLWIAKGTPKGEDKYYDPNAVGLEENVLLIKAKTEEHAVKRAEKEAKEYVVEDPTYVNCYGQKIKILYLGACDVFELFESPGNCVEVYSAVRVVDKKIGKKRMVDLMLGNPTTKSTRKQRKKFYNINI